MDAATLADAMLNRSGVDYGQYVDGCNVAMRLAQVVTVNRAAMFLAQVGAESGGLQWTTELADGTEYNGRVDLGNTQQGDGPRFKGRTFIQITGRNNYTKLSQWAHSVGLVPSADYFVLNPDLLSSVKYVWLGPVWYWMIDRPTLNAVSDSMDIRQATYMINGGLNGLAGRTARWQHCLSLGSKILPQPAPPTATPPSIITETKDDDDVPHFLRLTSGARKLVFSDGSHIDVLNKDDAVALCAYYDIANVDANQIPDGTAAAAEALIKVRKFPQ